MIRTFYQFFIVLCLVLGLASCAGDGPVGPEAHSTSLPVMKFVLEQNIPMFHSLDRSFLFGGVEGFRSEYGPAMDCEMGCVYRSAYGIRVGPRIGWLKFQSMGEFEPDSKDFYDVEATDMELFEAALWDLMHDDMYLNHFLWSGLLPNLARDPDTPMSVLENIAERLTTYVVMHVA